MSSSWRTKIGGAAAVEHPTKDAADAAVDEARRRYRAGARTMRTARLYSPDGGVQVVDFAAEDRTADRALREVQRATAVRDRAVREAQDQWEATIVRALALGQDAAAVAEAAGTTVREVRAIERRRRGPAT